MTLASKETDARLSEQMVHFFGDGKAATADRTVLGGKGAGLAEMSSLGIPVPPGFTITTEVCSAYYQNGRQFPAGLDEQVAEGIREIEERVGTRFGDPDNPLLVSVRSGARVSMPGMMDTILNLGLNDATAEGLTARSGNARFVYDSYRRFVQMYGDVVLGVGKASETDHDPFEALLNAKKAARGVSIDTELSAEDLKELVAEYKALVLERTGSPFPEDPKEQLWGAIGAVFSSWETPRAVVYREMHGYPGWWGTAVNVQAMVFGNLGDDCATGVLFTRNPSTGEALIFGEFLVNAQGEDVVAGTRTPSPISEAARGPHDPPSLEAQMPEAYRDLAAACATLEKHFRDMQDIEFTVQQGRLWILQTRNGKRSGQAMVKIAVDMVQEGLLSEREALLRLDPEQLNELLHPVFEPRARREVIASGLAASPGAAVGKVVFTPADAVQWAARGEDVILVRDETSPEDIEGMKEARAILTARGGMTSHAAVVARGMGKCCITGCADLEIDYARREFHVQVEGQGSVVVREGDVISLDGTSGEVMLGALPLAEALFPPEYDELMSWVDRERTLGVRANADTPEDAERARAFGAEGIGLCRTEHMFFGTDRILAMRQMILSQSEEERRAALEKILPFQREDFAGLLRAMSPFPVTIRLLDPPLHEFLPHTPPEVAELAAALGLKAADVEARVHNLSEFNPMLGHRGVRLAITYPEIYEIQVRAIMEAACALKKEGLEVHPEIMIPLVGMDTELQVLRALTEETADRVCEEMQVTVDYTVGTMIELPRACVVADSIAEHADFFSFGTNDLTQTTFGLSRDDAGRFLPSYIKHHLLERDPFVELDREGVGGLIRMGIERGRSVKPKLKVGICGEHGGNPPSVHFCHEAGLDYVSCSPYRVPIARLAAAQAALDGDTLEGLPSAH
ncbi:MAG: pyruvate, phosphate dikinase [Dehalococcoidia bacterium]|nr:pyruvate, phosphate dikinase [Dehalococcoidia bacterium]